MLLDHVIFGKLDGQTVIFVAGWPDTYSVFRNNLMAQLEREYRIVGITLPGFEQPATANNTSKKSDATVTTHRDVNMPFFGYSRRAAIAMLGDTFHHVMNTADTASASVAAQKPILVCHDWGALLSYEFVTKHASFFERIVMLDVGGNISGGESCSHTVKRMLFFIQYQWAIIFISYLCSAESSMAKLQAMCARMGRPEYMDCVSGKTAVPLWKMAWIYLNSYIDAFTLRELDTQKKCVAAPCPLLFLYSPVAPVTFHGPEWEAMLAARGAEDGLSKAVSVKGGHWFFARPEVVCDASRKMITDFIRTPLKGTS